jgi:hypothetical protein
LRIENYGILLSEEYEGAFCGEVPQGGVLEVHTAEFNAVAD